MKITVYSSKGSAGKTPISTNIVLDRGYAIGTNENFHLYDDFEAIPESHVLDVDMEEAFEGIDDSIDIVFDLAGSMSKSAESIRSAIKQSHLVIVPIFDQANSIAGGLGTIAEIENLNSNILIVATKLKKNRKEGKRTQWTQTEAFKNIEMQVRGEFNYPILPLRYSEAFDAMTEQEQSIAQMCDSNALLNHSYKDVRKQFDAIYKHIDEVKNARKK